MPSKPLEVVIPAFTIFPGGGLMHFVRQAVIALAKAKPQWTFTVINSIALNIFEDVDLPNINLVYYDGDKHSRLFQAALAQLLRPFGKSADAGFLIQSRCEQYHLTWGNPEIIYQTMNKGDVVWVPHYNITLEQHSEIFKAPQLSRPILLTVHDIHPSFYPEDHATGNLRRFFKDFVPFAYRANALITHSKFQKQAIVSHLGLPVDNIHVVAQPPLIDPQVLLRKKSNEEIVAAINRLGILQPYVFYPASTVHLHKNHARLLVAWSILKNKLGDRCPMLVCTGKGSRKQWKRLSRMIIDLDIQDKVTFVGQVNTSTLSVLFQQCLFVILPTLFEGSGSGILTDAYVLGKPVLCSRIPQILEQLVFLENAQVRFFDGESVLSIFEEVQKILDAFLNLPPQEPPVNAMIYPLFSSMWERWSECYISLLEEISHGV